MSTAAQAAARHDRANTAERNRFDFNPAMVPPEIERIYRKLETETERLAKMAEGHSMAEVQYKGAFARAYLKAGGTVPERESQATEDSLVEFQRWRSADSSFKAQRELLLTLRSEIDALRTLSANVRAVT